MNTMEAVGWALLHFLWQGAAVAAVLALLLWATRRRAATTRYALGITAMILMLLLPVSTTLRSMNAEPVAVSARSATHPSTGLEPQRDHRPRATDKAGAGLETTASPNRSRLAWRPVLDAVGRRLPLLVGIWFAGVLLLAIRLLVGFVQSRQLEVRDTRAVPEECRRAVEKLSARLHVGGARGDRLSSAGDPGACERLGRSLPTRAADAPGA
jgi:beta-lactamase regulating signal transducer with metallopeptidase domain